MSAVDKADGRNPDRGAAMQELRKAAGLTQHDAGVLVGVKAQAVSNWEAGERPAWHRIPRLDEAYKAGGKVMALFAARSVNSPSGLVRQSPEPVDLTELPGLVARLSEQVVELKERADKQDAELKRLAARIARGKTG